MRFPYCVLIFGVTNFILSYFMFCKVDEQSMNMNQNSNCKVFLINSICYNKDNNSDPIFYDLTLSYSAAVKIH